jgi:hypothetical protein
MVEEGSILGSPGLPLLSNETLITAVEEAHYHNKLAVAHALAAEAAKQIIAAGVDGLAHVWGLKKGLKRRVGCGGRGARKQLPKSSFSATLSQIHRYIWFTNSVPSL